MVDMKSPEMDEDEELEGTKDDDRDNSGNNSDDNDNDQLLYIQLLYIIMQTIVDEVEGEPQRKETPTEEIGAISSNFVPEMVHLSDDGADVFGRDNLSEDDERYAHNSSSKNPYPCKGRIISTKDNQLLETELKTLNKPLVKTIKTVRSEFEDRSSKPCLKLKIWCFGVVKVVDAENRRYKARKGGGRGISEEETKKKIYYVINEELSYKDKAFGDRMKYWTSINEPNLFANIAYMVGQYPPAHCSISLGNCSAGNSNVEPHGYAQHVTGTCGGHQAIPRPFAGN
ncbi:hypothetical protein LguiA_003900 [Lonicera macranthoides]